MGSAYESVGIRIDRLERALGELGHKIDQLVGTIANQTASIDRMERSVTQLVEGIKTQNECIKLQSESTKEFLATIREQNQIVKQALAMANPTLSGGKSGMVINSRIDGQFQCMAGSASKSKSIGSIVHLVGRSTA